jgi:hypothetical protein
MALFRDIGRSMFIRGMMPDQLGADVDIVVDTEREHSSCIVDVIEMLS